MKRALLCLVIVWTILPCLYGQEKNKILAVCAFENKGEATSEEGKSIAELVASSMPKTNCDLIERLQVQRVLIEKNAGHWSDEKDNVDELSQSLKADYLLIGCIDKKDGVYNGNYRMVEVATAKIQRFRDSITGARDYTDFANKLLASIKQQNNQEQQKQADMIKAAKQMAENIGQNLVANPPKTGVWQVAVFPFGNEKREATSLMGNLPLVFQSALGDALSAYIAEQMPGKFAVLELSQLRMAFFTAGKDPFGIGIGPENLKISYEVLQKVKIQVAIVGNYKIGDINIPNATQVEIESYVLLPNQKDNRLLQYSVTVGDLLHPTSKNSGRFGIRFFAKTNGEQWDELPLSQCKNEKCPFHNTFFLKLKPEMEGVRYKIRLTNKGGPSLDIDPLDKDRLFAVALFIDGVNSFYQERMQDITMIDACDKSSVVREKHTGLVIVHPRQAIKWVLTSPQRKLVPDATGMLREAINPANPTDKRTSRIEGGKIINVQGAGHSEIDVAGFQKDKQVAKAFVFGKPGDSVATRLGITEDIGLISAYFYAEKLPETPWITMGTKEGPEIDSKTFTIEFKTLPEPVQTLNVLYRYEGDNMPCLPDHLQK